MESEAKYQAHLKAEEEDQISEEVSLKAEDHKRAWLEVKEEFLLALEARHQAD